MDEILKRAMVVVMELLEEAPRDVKRAAIVALTLVMVGVIWLWRRRGNDRCPAFSADALG